MPADDHSRNHHYYHRRIGSRHELRVSVFLSARWRFVIAVMSVRSCLLCFSNGSKSQVGWIAHVFGNGVPQKLTSGEWKVFISGQMIGNEG
jgi:hypothetical protein